MTPLPTRGRASELLADHLLAPGPKRLGAFRIERIGPHAAADIGALDEIGDVAVLAIAAADVFGRRDHRRPDRGGGALRHRLVAEGGQRAGHDARIGDDDIERTTVRQQRVGAGAGAGELFPDWPDETFPLYAYHPSRHGCIHGTRPAASSAMILPVISS